MNGENYVESHLDETGDISLCYDMDKVSEIDYYNKSPYSTYFYGDNALMRIENLLEDDGLRVLLLHDSFSDCVIPFLSLGIEYLDTIDWTSCEDLFDFR